MASYDAIIIGTGQAGPPLAKRLAAVGMKVAIVERARFGGTCVNVGCIPTKSMVASAYVAHQARRAAEFGVHAGPVTVDMKAVIARKEQILSRSRTGVEKMLRTMTNCTVYQGHARFVAPRTVQVGDDRITAEKIFIDVGARAAIPAIPGLGDVPYLTNSTIMNLDSLPDHLIVLGGSYVGLEFGQMFRRFGSAVSIVEKGERVTAREDVDVSEAIQDILRAEEIGIHLNAECLQVTKWGSEISVSAGKREIVGSHLLVAAGRQPNTDDLGLETIGITVDSSGHIPVNDELQTAAEGVWALGDCNGRGRFTHTSYNDYEVVASNLLDRESRKVTDRIEAYAMFIDPPLGRVGMTEAQARVSGRQVLMGKRPMTKVARSVEKGESQGFMKVLVDAESKQILGASILGTGGDEAVHTLLDMMYAKAPYTVMERAVHIHPTVTEMIPTMLGELTLLH